MKTKEMFKPGLDEEGENLPVSHPRKEVFCLISLLEYAV